MAPPTHGCNPASQVDTPHSPGRTSLQDRGEKSFFASWPWQRAVEALSSNDRRKSVTKRNNNCVSKRGARGGVVWNRRGSATFAQQRI